ncbi:hypothetical protein PCL_09145 [Purpureocillium lilacinum]|uniref:Uncharacterized protein n=1 Tax=Purpureocillium lilacinum TaxID=33203 RepID=A0A2U3EH80_PURLI|nr:hypothetical protein PCL_09145 [Purpureocillium lilacinum]
MALTPDAPAESAGTRSHLWTSGPQSSSHYSLVLERLAIEMLGPDRCMASGLVRGWRSAKGKTLVLVWRAVQSVLRLYRRGTFRVEAHPTTTFSCTLPAVRVPGCLPSGRVPEELGGPIRALAVPNDCTTTPYYLRSRDGRGGVQVPVLPANSRSRSPGQMVLGPASKPSRAPHTVPVGAGVGVRVVDVDGGVDVDVGVGGGYLPSDLQLAPACPSQTGIGLHSKGNWGAWPRPASPSTIGRQNTQRPKRSQALSLTGA